MLGDSAPELARLIEQARFFGQLTENLLVEAGLARGMRVYRTVAEIVRTLISVIERAGLATAEEIAIDTLEDCLRSEVVSADAVIVVPPFVGAWGTKALTGLP